eukprot:TRINITY_DN8692_c0_g8_i1.p1 TRINITY_DN8692_c0_g8~~TRINITY_DN8692_c0_g8_i1.p1  ORF type:complete len:570 (+),score=159.60 TRINITY_DN8692_c0_g8_i1:75-1712(+)
MPGPAMRAALLLAAFSGGAAAQTVVAPTNTSGAPAVLGFVGRSDGSYTKLLSAVQTAAGAQGIALWTVTGASFAAMADTVSSLKAAHPGARTFYAGHGMVDGSGGAAAQDYAATDKDAAGVLLVAAFLRRTLRPSVADCAKKWAVQPTHKCPKGKGLPLCPGGYLPEGVHSCTGPTVPTPEYAVPTLTVGGALDGVVRVARIAEAWYTQRATAHHEVALVEGMNHGDLMDGAVPAVTARDLPSELGSDAARAAVAELAAAFLAAPGRSTPPSPAAFFAPFTKMFVEQEGSWWWTSNSEEGGSSPWAAQAQARMADPMPQGFAQWKSLVNEFHLLSDESGIPPYYREKHRPNVTVQGKQPEGHTVSQLRYIELTVLKVGMGENGYELIKEEKSGVLNEIKDDGADYTSAIEIATKMASRQLAWNRTGAAADKSLDDGDRCKDINQAAYDLALQAASPSARARFQAKGRPLVMVADKSPFPPAGPWFIWNYLQYDDKGTSGVQVQSWKVFYALDAAKYGAGNHYCKLLSPARALEWIYTDGLRPSSK